MPFSECSDEDRPVAALTCKRRANFNNFLCIPGMVGGYHLNGPFLRFSIEYWIEQVIVFRSHLHRIRTPGSGHNRPSNALRRVPGLASRTEQ